MIILKLDKKIVTPVLLLGLVSIVVSGCGNKSNFSKKNVYVPKNVINTYNNVDYSFVLESNSKEGYSFTDGLLDYSITNVNYNKGELSLDLVVTSRGIDISNFVLPILSFDNSILKDSKNLTVSLDSQINKPVYIPKNTQFTLKYKSPKGATIGTFGEFYVNSSVGQYKFKYSFLNGQPDLDKNKEIGGDKNE